MAELLQRMSSSEIEEWIIELGTLRPEEERAAMAEAEGGASKPLTRADIAHLEGA